MKKFAIVFALLLAFLLAPAGCGKDKKSDHNAGTSESADADESLAPAAYTPRPRAWDQYYVGEVVIDMPASAPADEGGDSGGDSLDDDLDALFGGDSSDDSADSEPLDMTVGGEVTLPFVLYLTSEDINTGKVTGDIEWTSLGASNEVEGEVARGSIKFEEISTVIDGRETGCTYELTPDPNAAKGTLSGAVDCSSGPGGTGTITMTIESLAGGGSDANMDSGGDDDFNLDLGDLESNLDDASDDTDDSGFNESDFDAMFDSDDADSDAALDDLLGGNSKKPAADDDEDMDAALDALLGGGDEKPKPKPAEKPAPAKKPEPKPDKKPEAKPEKKPAPPAKDTSGGVEEEPMDLLMDMIDDTDVD
jgi:hypothetical protein